MGAAAVATINATVTNHDPFAQNEAAKFQRAVRNSYREQYRIGKNVSGIQNGSWFKFNALDFGAGANSLELRVASATNGGTLEDSPR